MLQSLKAKLWLLSLVSSLGILTLAVSAIWHAEHSKTTLLRFVDNGVAVNQAANGAYAQGLQMGQALRNILLDPANRKAYDNFRDAERKFADEMTVLNGLLPQGSEAGGILARLKTNIAQWQPLQKQIMDLVAAQNRADAQALLVAKETPTWRAVRDDLLDLIKRSGADAEKERAALTEELASSRLFAVALSLLAFAAVAATAFMVARGVIRQVGGEPAEVALDLHRIAEGDLTQDIRVASGDSSSIIAATRTMQQQMRDLISRTVGSAASVVQEADTLRAAAATLATTAQDQSNAAAAIAATVEQLTVGIGQMSDHAGEAKRLAEASAQHGVAGLDAVTSATGTIQSVADTMTEAAAAMSRLADAVTGINAMVNTIHEIADQTNMLALNAAIEAARAGEQGRGFAVVADEVRGLAERTTASTQQIGNIVGNAVSTTQSALAAMNSAKEQALSGLARTEEVRGAVAVMAQSSAEVGKAIDAIADALREQAAASQDIAVRIEGIAQGTEQTHAASDRSSRQTELLSALSQSLKESVSRFRL
jgi:methyl-accepting chemotaxis protein